jgi:uncharacterized protein with GYD domain
MATYVTLYRFTAKGIEHIKDSPARVEAAKKAARALGGEVKAFFMTLGSYDTLAILSAPDDETAARINLSICAEGNVQSLTMRAFNEEEYRAIIRSLP